MPEVPGWLVFNGLVMAPAAAFALSLAPKFIPAPQVAMFFLLETVLAPIWVWLIFSETLTPATLVGGSIVLLAIAGHSFFQLRRHSTSRRTKPT
jgi:drug/metabolite transporter (DMT)-like permease